MRRAAAVVLLLVAACTGGGKPAPTALPTARPTDECERELPNARTLVTTLRASDGKQQGERRIPDSTRPTGLFTQQAARKAFPPIQVRVTEKRNEMFGSYGVTVHPSGAPAWQLKDDGYLLTQVGDLLLGGSRAHPLFVDRVDGTLVWETKPVPGPDFERTDVVGLADDDPIVLVQHEHSPTGKPFERSYFLERVQLGTGAVRWKTRLPRGDQAAVVGDRVYVIASAHSAHGQGELATYDVQGGFRWKKRVPLPLVDDVNLDRDQVLVRSSTIYMGGCR